MGQPINQCCEYCNINCETREMCKEFYRYIIFEKIRKLETEIYCLNAMLK